MLLSCSFPLIIGTAHALPTALGIDVALRVVVFEKVLVIAERFRKLKEFRIVIESSLVKTKQQNEMGCIISREHLLKCEMMKCIAVIASWQAISPRLDSSMHVPRFYLFFCFHQLLISSINCLYSFSSVSLPNVLLLVSVCFDGGRLVITHHNHNSYHALSTYPQSALFVLIASSF